MKLLGIGTATPPLSIRQEEAARLAGSLCAATDSQARVVEELFRRSGVRMRHSVVVEEGGDSAGKGGGNGSGIVQSFYPPACHGNARGPGTAARMRRYAETAPGLAVAASRPALERASTEPAGITHLVTVSCTGLAAPGVDVRLIKGLGLRPATQRTHVGFMGCHGAINGLRVAQAVVGSQPDARVLLCAVELCSLHFHYGWDAEAIVPNALFADGAAALVLARDEADDSRSWRLRATGSFLFDDSEDDMTWSVGDHGFRMTLSPRVPELIARRLRPWLEPWLESHGLDVESIGSWAVHPGGPRVLSAVAEALSLPGDSMRPSRDVLERFGNMSSPTVLFIMERLMESGAARPAVVLAFGPGLSVEAAIFN